MKMLHEQRVLYVPQNGHRSTSQAVSDTKEDMMEIFQTDVNGTIREYKRLMGRRNYVAIVAYDPDNIPAMADVNTGNVVGGAGFSQGKLSLAVDFMVQGEGAYGGPVKYGPVVIPCLEFGR